jgi:hypothetical protein
VDAGLFGLVRAIILFVLIFFFRMNRFNWLVDRWFNNGDLFNGFLLFGVLQKAQEIVQEIVIGVVIGVFVNVGISLSF